MRFTANTLVAMVLAFGFAASAHAQTANSKPAKPEPTPEPAKSEPATDAAKPASPSLVVYFASGSSKLRAQDLAVLDKASRAYNEGKPIVMILTGTSDRVGNAHANLALSERRASAVLTGLLDRGIPADRFQVLAKGETEPSVPTPQGVAEEKNRRVEITWR